MKELLLPDLMKLKKRSKYFVSFSFNSVEKELAIWIALEQTMRAFFSYHDHRAEQSLVLSFNIPSLLFA